MKFIADSMLGRLARWLRLLGYDTLYYSHIEDSRLLIIARRDERTLLTRDTGLVRRREMPNFLLLDENDSFEQLKKVITTFKLVPKNKFEDLNSLPVLNRCILCNAILDNIPKERAMANVPAYVYRTSDSFKRCPDCGKYYWMGTHPEKIRKKLAEIFKICG